MTDPTRPGATAPSGAEQEYARPSGARGSFDLPPERRPAPPRPPLPPAPGQQTAFGRPERVRGSFAGDRPGGLPRPAAPPPPPEAVLRAFAPGRPGERGLGDPPGGRAPRRRTASAPWWKPDAAADPWRDPYAPASLGAPAEYPDEDEQPGPLVTDARGRTRLRVRQLSIPLSILTVLVMLFSGAVGGSAGWLLTRTADEEPLLSPDAQLSQTSEGITREPGSVSDIAGRVSPAVVSVEVRVGEAGATGSGVVIDAENGYIVTNNHVISGAADVEGAEIRAVFNDGSGSAARIVGRDPASDIAVIKVEKPQLLAATLGTSDSVVVGDPVVAIGSPLGLAGTVTSGIVSALDRPVRLSGEGSDTNAVISAVQTDAPINPGNSGGALVDATGAVIGINTAIASLGGNGTTGGSIGLGFAIPIDTVRDISEQLITTGEAVHASLGVSTRSVTDGTRDGALVLNVDPGGPGEQAGIDEQDVIIRVGDTRIGSSEELAVAVDAQDPGEQIEVELVRGGASRTVTATLGTA
ncbi:PDZ domain-containing protein [Modestobacter sp. I12A-02628]|uniref:PDZ domain-containing protein n=1 Tax=Goekera deserti TaxID=2497753 RepID=A0A7K3WCF6_9ACTN|nr:trypsin-like peptidase domain-containing protein [Goekera deserti]MPQ98495.1 PDZ domain-containing protein [Goekera deserti]NDI48325.1 PDZ domain-containing protein [Goekera deserti]NEL54074.1 PDZ domain-containing protein [Goekera deserti]